MAGLLDILNTDQGRMGLGLLAAAGPRSDGAGFGQRMQEGMGSFDAYKANALKQKMLQAQMQQAMEQAAQQKADRARQQTIQQGMGKFFKPGQQALAPLIGDAATGIMPSAGRDAVAPSFDAAGAAQFLADNGDYEQALKLMPKPKELQINKLNASDFTPASLAKFAQSQNYGDLERLEKASFQNTGSKTYALNPFTGLPLNSIENTQDPNSRASVAATLRGQNMTDARSREANAIQKQSSRTQIMQTPEGLIAIDKGTNQAAPVTMGGSPVRSEDSMKKTANAKTVIALLDEADKLLPTSTGSLVGTGVDMALGTVGVSTKGAKSNAQLKAIEGQLIASMPRMEGPQSDSDRLLYQKAAGDLANPMTPVPTRQAASATIRRLQERYTGGASGGGASGGWSITKE